MNIKIKLFGIIFLIILIYSCKKENRWDCFKGSGNDIEETRLLAAFENIEVNDYFNVYIKQDSVYRVIIDGSENLNGLIETKVENACLKLDNKNKCSWSRKYKDINIYVHSPKIKMVSLNVESNLFSIDTIKADSFHVDVRASIANIDVIIDCNYSALTIHAGTGDYTIKGKANKNYLYCHGTGFIRTENLIADEVEILHISTGDFFVNCTKKLSGDLMGSGNIYYKGDPEKISVKLLSSGKVLKYE